MVARVIIRRFIRYAVLSVWAICLPMTTWAGEEALVEVSQSDMQFSRMGSTEMVVVVGKLRNLSAYAVEEVSIEAQFFNDQGALIDTAAEILYAAKVPAHGEVAFKIETSATQPQDRYARHQIRVLAANEDKPRVSPAKKNPVWMSTLISWAPMLLFIAVWLLLVRKYSAKGSPQRRTIELIEQQNELLAKQVTELKRLADAAERGRRPEREDEHEH